MEPLGALMHRIESDHIIIIITIIIIIFTFFIARAIEFVMNHTLGKQLTFQNTHKLPFSGMEFD